MDEMNLHINDEPESNDERIRFSVSIRKDGTTVIHDVPSEIIPIIKTLYPEIQIRCKERFKRGRSSPDDEL